MDDSIDANILGLVDWFSFILTIKPLRPRQRPDRQKSLFLKLTSAIIIFVRDVKGRYQTIQVHKKKLEIKMKKAIGIGFLLVSALVLYFSCVGWPSLDINLWSLILVDLFLFFTLENLLKKDYKASLMCLIIVFIIANAIFDRLPISSGMVIGAGVLACIGIGYLFPDKDKKEDKQKEAGIKRF